MFENQKVTVVFLAAGLGKRMKSQLPKVMHPILGKPILEYEVELIENLQIGNKIAVVGHGRELLKTYFKERLNYAVQEKQLGTGDAIKSIFQPHLEKFLKENILILCGDTPLLELETIQQFLEYFFAERENISGLVLTVETDTPYGYGRVVKDKEGNVSKIVEEKDATPEEQKIKEINTGIYVLKRSVLEKYIKELKSDNAQSEYYLTDLIELVYKKENLKLKSFQATNFEQFAGINNRYQLSKAEAVLLHKKLENLMLSGVRIINPETVYIEWDVKVAKDTLISSGSILRGKTVVGEGCEIWGGSYLENAVIGNKVKILSSYIIDSSVSQNCSVGPFAHLRNKSIISADCRIGNFVEIKNSFLEKGVKSAHLTYLGDAKIGENTNIGAGTITCNYDGKNKHPTTLGKNVFIGSNSALVAPIKIGDNSYVGAGSTLTQDVPPWSLALGRARQVIKEGWVKRKKEETGEKSQNG
jgi:bifunctional UDP-N-acetylglucosamine pyrophosphorylase/glucosamine-1-phosphate N-acetyltransferase